MSHYNEQQSRFDQAFHGLRTTTAIDCCCGRVHFVSASGHGDFEEGELKSLQAKAKERPEKYIEEREYDHVDACFIDSRPIIVSCPCNTYQKYCDFIECYAEELVKYLKLYFEAKLEVARREVQQAEVLGSTLDQMKFESSK